MKQKLDEVRTLAIKLYKAGQKENRKHSCQIWGFDCHREWRDLPSETVLIWDAIAIEAYRQLRRRK